MSYDPDENDYYAKNGYPDGRGHVFRAEMCQALIAYARAGEPVGGFLQAVLSNDLMAAVCRADQDNIRNLPAGALFIYNELPSPCHGSPAKYEAWLAKFETPKEKTNGT